MNLPRWVLHLATAPLKAPSLISRSQTTRESRPISLAPCANFLIRLPLLQAVTTAQSGVEGATQRLEETQTQLIHLQTQRDSQAQPDEASIEDLEVKIAEETHSISSLAQQVRAALHLLLFSCQSFRPPLLGSYFGTTQHIC